MRGAERPLGLQDKDVLNLLFALLKNSSTSFPIDLSIEHNILIRTY